MGRASIAFPGGPGLTFRIDPQSIDWDFEIRTNGGQNTVGGRVVQVLGARLSDLTIMGQFGENVDYAKDKPSGQFEHSGRSWRIARRFVGRVRQMIEWQGKDAQNFNLMTPPAVFTYEPRKWKFRVYIKGIADPDGGAITFDSAKFSHSYALTLFVVQEGTDDLVKAGSRDGVIDAAREKAIGQYISRIADGIGWEPTKYNGDFLNYYGGMGLGDYGSGLLTSYGDENRSPRPQDRKRKDRG